MSKKVSRASLSKGRSSWCVIFHHPVCLASDGKRKLRVRRGLGTSDESLAQSMVDQLNEILGDSIMWSMSQKVRAESKYDSRIVAAFYDHMQPEAYDPWLVREEMIPLPGGKGSGDGYTRVLFVGTTGAGKTTVVRQLLGTHPKLERFPSISAAKTTICDIEIVTKDDSDFEAVITFMRRGLISQVIGECVLAAVVSELDAASEREVVRKFLEHTEQRFRLSYILGNPFLLREIDDDLFDDDDGDEYEYTGEAEVSGQDRLKLLEALECYLNHIKGLAESSRAFLIQAANELGIKIDDTSKQDQEVLQELLEDKLVEDEEFHGLVDEIMEDIETRFELLSEGELVRGRDGWPIKWSYKTNNRSEFIKNVNRFSSNYAPNFGSLLTPLVEGIRVAGSFMPDWIEEGNHKLVLMDGQGIGHIAGSTSSLSTSVTKRFKLADTIVLVDHAAQPMQVAPCAVLHSLVASGNESKLVLAFTHFDEVKGDNLIGQSARKDHVLGSFDNAIRATGKVFGREAELALSRLIPERVLFFSNVHKTLTPKSKFTLGELGRFHEIISSTTEPVGPTIYKPVYDVANLVLAVQKATEEFHDRWRGALGFVSKSGVTKEHWARIKALTRRLGIYQVDEYSNLMPVADLICLLQAQVSNFLLNPLKWEPEAPPTDSEERLEVIDSIKMEVFNRLHELSRRRILDEQVGEWVVAFGHRGAGSTRIRARGVASLYEDAAPIPDGLPDANANTFLFELRELIAESVCAGNGLLRGWSRKSEHGE